MPDFSKTEIFREATWRKCARDPEFFFENYWRIQHPEEGSIPFKLFDSQRDALEIFQRERYVITLKARQIGWTTLVGAYAAWLALFNRDRLVIFLSKGEREAAVIQQKVAHGYQRLPTWMRDRIGAPIRNNQTLLELPNGSSVESLPSKSDPARGRSCYLVVVDEWAMLENPEEAWASIEPIADVGGRVIGLSTAKGWGTFFHTTWLDAEKGDNLFFPLFQPWDARDDRDPDWYEVKKSALPAWQLHQEYPRNPNEAFLKSGNPYFDVDALSELPVDDPEYGFINVGPDGFPTFIEQDGGALRLYERPLYQESYVIGADVAEGLEFGDFSSAHVIHWRTHKVVAHWHGHLPPDEFATVLNDLGLYYNSALVGVENNNHGLTTLKFLKEFHRYPHIYYMRTVDERNSRVSNKLGWNTNKKTRPLMLDDLATELRERTIGLSDKRTISELMTFVRDEAGRLRGSPFDDCVFSLAIAIQMLGFVSQHHTNRRSAEYGTLAWWHSTIRKEPEIQVIGANNIRSL